MNSSTPHRHTDLSSLFSAEDFVVTSFLDFCSLRFESISTFFGNVTSRLLQLLQKLRISGYCGCPVIKYLVPLNSLTSLKHALYLDFIRFGL